VVDRAGDIAEVDLGAIAAGDEIDLDVGCPTSTWMSVFRGAPEAVTV
jgi:hypothetical protein